MKTIKRSLLLYGPPGSGKTTVAKHLARDLDVDYLSVGDITRKEIAAGTETGKQLKYYLDEIVEYPVDLISSVVGSHMHNTLNKGRNFILDGFPKYHWEAERFVEMTETDNIKIDAAVVLEVPVQEVLKRIENRRICQDCHTQVQIKIEGEVCPKCNGNLVIREDDKQENFVRRYNDHIGAIEATLKVLNGHIERTIKVDAAPPENQVVESIENQI